MEFAKKTIEEKGYKTWVSNDNKHLIIERELGKIIRFFPYSGWHSGSGIKYGRGLQNLLKQI
ncbi:MAG: hypothetical protein HC892_10045 [Saprospiraceae bacterium]|nr:hypothetical protein [Saprospiraceae bacterium]